MDSNSSDQSSLNGCSNHVNQPADNMKGKVFFATRATITSSRTTHDEVFHNRVNSVILCLIESQHKIHEIIL
jgi:hypothetical protein